MNSIRRTISTRNIIWHCFEWLQHCSNIPVIFPVLCCAKNRRCESVSSTFKDIKFPSDDNFFFLSKIWLNSFKIVAISLPSHRNYTTQSFAQKRNSWDQTIAYTEISSSFWFGSLMMSIENIQEFRSGGAWKVSFCAQFPCRLTKWQ